MNQLCKVCGEPAAGFHFGAFTCEGCKSFFGRTYNNISAIAGCKNNGDCVINKKNRTACKACRLRKCLLVGMSKSGSRYGRRSNWFKIHCLLQEQQQGTGPGGGGGGGGNNNFEQLARLHQMQARQTYQDKTNPCIKSASMSPTLSLAAAGLSQQQQQQATASAALQHQQQQQQQQQRLPNYLTAAKFLNGVIAANCNETKSAESRLRVTPSDSGASSAGDAPDDCNSLTSHWRSSSSGKKLIEGDTIAAVGRVSESEATFRDCDNANAEEQESRRQQLLQIFRSHSEPLKSPFAAFVISNFPPPNLTITPPLHFLPAQTLQNTEIRTVSEDNVRSSSAQEQHEPIDLSLKASRETTICRRRSQTPPSPSECEDSGGRSSVLNNLDVIPKPTPLDLTLVHSQTLTG